MKKNFTFLFLILMVTISAISQPAVQSQQLLGGTGNENLYGYSNKPTSDGGAILCGNTTSSNTGTFTGLTNNGGLDGVIIKLDASGNTTLQKIYGGSGDDELVSIRQTADGGYIAAGDAQSSNSGTLTGITNNGGKDGWVIKTDASGNIVWQKLLGGNADDEINSIRQTSDGGYIASGDAHSSNSGTLAGITNNGTTDGWILKLDANGNTVWQKLLGGGDVDRFIESAQTTDGGYIAVGTATGSNGTLTGVPYYGNLDGWIIKFDAAGNTTWQKLYGGDSQDQFGNVEQTTDGGYIIAGNAANVNSVNGTYTEAGYGQYDGWVVKTDGSGNLQWQKLFGSGGQDLFFGVQLTSDGGYILSGQSSSTPSNPGTLNGLTNNGGYDGWIVKLNGAGDMQWQELLGGTLDDDLFAVQETSGGGYFAVGYSSSSNTGTLTGLTSNGGIDGWTVKLAPYATSTKPGSGNGLAFYGTGSLATSPYVNAGSGFEFGTQPFTYETWLKRDTVETTLNNAGKSLFGGDDFGGWGIAIFNNNTLFLTKLGVNYVASTGTVADTNWHHVAVVYTGTQVQFYIDGVLSGTPAFTAAFNNSSANYIIGSNSQNFGNSNGDQTLAGKMDETRIWKNVALTQTEIRDWMCKKVTSAHPAYNNLFGYFRFDEGTGDTTYSADGRVGLLINTPTWLTSGASIGDASAYDYTNATKTATISASTGETFTATSTSGSPAGIQVYRVDTLPNTLTGTIGTGGNHKYFGVFQSGGTSPLYSAVYNYGGYTAISGNDPNGFRLYRRINNADILWTDAVATLNTTNKTLTVAGASTEYMLGSILNPLPLKLISFSAIKNGSDVILNWQTANEENLKNYVVEKSIDARKFTQLAVVNANDNPRTNNYTATDMNPVNGVNYYRLKQIDLEGNYTYSDIRSVNFSDNLKVFISPNPAINNIKIYSDQMLKSVQVMDMSGKIIKWLIPTSNNLYDVSDLQKGIYFLRITTNTETQTLRLAKL